MFVKCKPVSSAGYCVAAVVAALAWNTPAAAQAPISMKIGTATINDTQHEYIKRYAELVEQRSKGRIKPEIYPGSQLGTVFRVIEQIQLGAIQAYAVPPDFLTKLDPRFEALGGPGWFKTMQDASKTIEDPEFLRGLYELGSNKGFKVVGLFLSGPMSFAMKQPVNTLQDLKNKKVRVLASDIQMEQVRRVGATPVVISFPETIPALQQGTIDGSMNSLPVLAASRYYEVSPYAYEVNESMVTTLGLVSKMWLDRLPNDLKAAVLSAGQDAAKGVGPWSVEFFDQQRKIWLDNGGKIVQPSASEKAELHSSFQAMVTALFKDKPEVAAMYNLLLNASKRR